MLYQGTLNIVPNSPNIYKYITGIWNKDQPLNRDRQGKRGDREGKGKESGWGRGIGKGTRGSVH